MRKNKMLTQDQARVCNDQHKTPCVDCPWRRTAIPGWLGSLTAQEWIARAQGDAPIECHTLKNPEGDFFDCAGAAIFRANICKLPKSPDALKLPSDRKKVFGIWTEFLEYHSL